MAFIETTLGIILGIILVGAFFIYLFLHFFNFAMQGLKYLGILIILMVIAGIVGLFESLFPSDKETKPSNFQLENQFEQLFTEDNSAKTEAAIDSLLYDFLLAYETNDQATTQAYMKEDAKITKQHLDYMAYQQKNGIKLELIDYQLYDVIPISDDRLQTITIEQFLVHHPKNGTQSITQEIRYTIQKDHNQLFIQNLEVLEQYK